MAFKKKNTTEKKYQWKPEEMPEELVSADHVRKKMEGSDDFKERIIEAEGRTLYLFFLSSMVDDARLEERIIKPLSLSAGNLIEKQAQTQEVQRTSILSDALKGILTGYCFAMEHDSSEGVLLSAASSLSREISDPADEHIIQGSHEGFIENIGKNLLLIRKRIENPNLKVKYITIGKATNTASALIYIENLTSGKLITEITKRLASISMDSIQSPGFIQDCIEDHPFSPFPQILNTERPDRAAAHLMEGRAVLITDGSPSVMIMPVTFFAFFQSPEDYNNRWYLGSFFRFLRLISFILSLILPAFYVAVVSYHHEIVPIELVYTLQASLNFVPVPPVIEAMFMQLALELLREAAVRLPQPIAQTIGIVGGLVIGTAVVEAGLVSNVMIIVVALTAIASFVIPSIEMSNTLRFIGFPLMLLASIFGFIGIVFGLLLLVIHLAQLKSFGVPYFSPFAPLRLKELKDTFIRVPVWLMKKRPKDSMAASLTKQGSSRGWKRNESEDTY
ncbi:spore germination protein [Bacillus sp. AG4(2022)]|uniref:spore germination protein n=1 Tax=Bacillus sp. AG4(2022) TaxID=2962594 RepID=UPI00288172F3|nr:spore germination protein [Bacillus sp. AG4(2022)]MDT0158859.1 spore germination protein [Bacillus sp. AG4(2022)]